jgi:hypothetical protein
MADTIHTTRTKSTSVKRFADAPRIAVGHKAAKYVYGLYERDLRNDDLDKMVTVERDFYRLSCSLNVADWSYRQRFTGCQDIVAACKACEEAGWLADGLKGKPAAIIRSLLDFRTTFNADAVLEALTDLNYVDLSSKSNSRDKKSARNPGERLHQSTTRLDQEVFDC